MDSDVVFALYMLRIINLAASSSRTLQDAECVSTIVLEEDRLKNYIAIIDVIWGMFVYNLYPNRSITDAVRSHFRTII